jgi:hypothetical protein
VNSLDLHKIDGDKIEFEIERFVTNNFSQLPVKVITGNSNQNIKKLNDVIKRHGLELYMEGWTNTGAYIVRPEFLM